MENLQTQLMQDKFKQVLGFFKKQNRSNILNYGEMADLNLRRCNSSLLIGDYNNSQKQVDATMMLDQKQDYGKSQVRVIGCKNIVIKTNRKVQIYEVGFYFNHLRVGRWSLIMNADLIGGGYYNLHGQKHGKWREISDDFTNQCLVIEDGEYKNGKKVGIWEIFLSQKEIINLNLCKISQINIQQFSGFGQYFDQGEADSAKDGKWYELGKGFSEYSQITLFGSYKRGKKIGYWRVKQDKQLIEGGGYEELNGQQEVKNGKWIETVDGDHSIIYTGEYRNNQKIGRWEIFSKIGFNKTLWLVGGGTYNFQQEQGSVKKGKWIELHDKFRKECQVTYTGEYRNNKKIGQWDTFYYDGRNNNIQIGGGTYREKDFIKIGIWIELSENFQEYSEVTYCGEYQNNNKVGRWDIWYKNHYDQKNEQIGGGTYSEVKQFGSIKIGTWIELSASFYYHKQTIFQGEYKNGFKIGQWKRFQYVIISFNSGIVNFNSIFLVVSNILIYKAIGYMRVLGQLYNYFRNSFFIFSGEFRNRKKVGRWDTFYRQFRKNPYKLIGGGEYQEVEEDHSIKIGMWIELSEGFYGQAQITNNGEYKNGNKIGRWGITYKKSELESFEQIGGGMYASMENLGSIKIGNWIDLSERFYSGSQVIYSGDIQTALNLGIGIFCIERTDKINSNLQEVVYMMQLKIKAQLKLEIGLN
ncbi:unnamed protein product [Paramecium octaurelia]|uniref:Uncharacterized protein n=1 Tax=Paramecium octaurelia TaxID=43137 RepID=A0A8S1WTU0_PAROT|nr:unnamed protein product [Paramecium octaurelia]